MTTAAKNCATVGDGTCDEVASSNSRSSTDAWRVLFGNLQQRAIQIFLDEPAPQGSAGQFPRFVPVLQAGQGRRCVSHFHPQALLEVSCGKSTRGNIASWLGNDGVALIFDRGVLHGTRGIGAGLLASDVAQTADAVLGGRSGNVERIHSYLNGNDETDIRAYACTITNEGSETIQLDNGATSTRRMKEVCRNLDHQFTNTYWVDTRRDRIVQSRQWTGEFAGELVIKTVYNF